MNTVDISPPEERINYIYSRARLIAKQLCPLRCDQDDLVQDAMVKALDNYHKIPLPDQDTFYWLRTVMRNMRISEIRKLKIRNAAIFPIETQENPKHGESPEPHMQLCDILDFLQKLKRDNHIGIREFILFVHGHKIREISALEGVNISTVKGRIFRTRDLVIAYSKN